MRLTRLDDLVWRSERAARACGIAVLISCLGLTASNADRLPAGDSPAVGDAPLEGPAGSPEGVLSGRKRRGELAYLEKCAVCHGDRGEGAEGYERSLAGDWPPTQLAKYITKSMPEGAPEDCVDEEAELVAGYIYDAFYSPIAQARIRPPRRELSRLTVRQYQQTIADLLQSFRPSVAAASESGLTARFYRGSRARKSRLIAERVDRTVDFRMTDTKELPPEILDPPVSDTVVKLAEQIAELKAIKKLEGDQKKQLDELAQKKRGLDRERERRRRVLFRWTGGLRAERTGEHELIVESVAGFELNFNGQKKLINARVLSKGERRRSATVWLIEGRTYPIELLVNRTTQAEAPVRLLWVPPGGVEALVPARFLSPQWRPPVTLATTRFPPDDRSVGYVRGASVSGAWVDAATQASLDVARDVADSLPELLELESGLNQNRGDAKEFTQEFAERAFRRPLSAGEREVFVDKWFKDRPNTKASVMMSTLAVLSSPRFLYPELGTAAASVDYRNASRLALALWDSLPDKRLLRAAARGKLRTREQITRHAERMLDDPRTRSKLSEFFRTWLHFDRGEELARDPMAFPDFRPRVAEDMRTSLELFLNRVVWEGDGDFRQLFLSRELLVNDNLASFLGIDSAGEREGFWVVPPETNERAGVVTHPFLVATLAYSRETSPIHRGVFLARNILGRSLRPPPEAVAPLPPDLQPDLTTRERVALQTSPNACQSCHVMINQLGFTLERFDAVGRLRETEAGQPVDASGFYVGLDGRETKFGGARDLAEFLASSDDVYRAFVVQLMEHVSKQPVPAYGPDTVDRLLAVFDESGYSIRRVLVEAAVLASLVEG